MRHRSLPRLGELHALIVKTEGALPCLQLHLRPDGTIVTKGCFSAIYRTSGFLWVRAAALAVAFWSAVVGLRRACDIAMTPAPIPVSLEFEDRHVISLGMMMVLNEPTPKPPPPPPATPELLKSKIDRAPPLRHLESEEPILPPGWRD